jgi:cold-inducible RNA-binding protein
LTCPRKLSCYTFAAFDCSPDPDDFDNSFRCLRARLISPQSNSSIEGIRVKNIFVGNLDFNTGEEELRRAFEAYGQVDRVSILTDRDTGRSRGFGFVEMSNSEEGDKAINALNGSQIGGRTVNVNEARPKPERTGGGGGGGGRGGRGERGGGGGGRRDRW